MYIFSRSYMYCSEFLFVFVDVDLTSYEVFFCEFAHPISGQFLSRFVSRSACENTDTKDKR